VRNPEHALDDGAERAVLLGEALRVHPQELLEVLLDQPEERGLPRPARPVHPRTDLHATPRRSVEVSGPATLTAFLNVDAVFTCSTSVV